ncbi:Cytosolic sulfotransferase 5 [Sesamum alatum]|uniref:Sulfotransferase n=1 Tax=Sesamum alatum TaxID=300844 RepID=A0AAE2CLF9_9LAMI|nr:Cytosolic sulfotransferase 5 [Sesamum alatum]
METSELDKNDINSSPQREKWCGHEFLYKFQGFWFTKTYLEATKKVLETFKPLPGDVILASFPKTGTTWLKAILHSIIHPSPRHENHPLTLNHPHQLIRSLETNLYIEKWTELGGTGSTKTPEFPAVKDPKKARILATHLPYQILGDILSFSDCKIVYVTRNPKDTLVSLWHFVQKSSSAEKDPWEVEAAVDQFCRGVVPFGPYYDHVLAYWEQSLNRPGNVHFLTYEELKENPKFHVRKLGEFLRCPFDQSEDGEEKIEEIVKMCSFESLSSQQVNKSNELPGVFPLPYSSFFRKGEVGDHKNYLEDKMIAKIDGITRKKFSRQWFYVWDLGQVTNPFSFLSVYE